MEPNDSPDSTVNTERPKVPPLILIGEKKIASQAKNHTLISRMSYNSATNSYSHVPSTNNSEPSSNKVIIIPKKATSSLEKLSYMIKEVDTGGAGGSNNINNSAGGNNNSNNNSSSKAAYGSQSRAPVRNFLRPSFINSKLEKSSRKVYSHSPSTSIVGSTTTTTTTTKHNNNSSLNHEVESSHRSNSVTRALTTTFVTTTADSPNQSIKLHIRRNPEHDSPRIVESPDSSFDSNDSSALDSSRNSCSNDDASSSNNINSSINNSYVASSMDDGSLKTTLTPVSVRENNCKANNSVIRQLHPDFMKQVEKQAHGRVVEIAIDGNGKNNNMHVSMISEDDQLNDEDGEEMDTTEEQDDEEKVSNSENSTKFQGGSKQSGKNNTITIEIGEHGVISESGNADDSLEDSGRMRRKRKPTKQFTPEPLIPRLKIRRRNEAEAEGSSGAVSFSFETVDDKEPQVDSTSSVEIKKEEEEEEEEEPEPEPEPEPVMEGHLPPKKPGRGRPRGSSNKAKVQPPPKPPGTGRGRGRPRGSTNKSKTEKEKTKSLASPNSTSEAEAASTADDDLKSLEDLPLVQVDIPLVPVEFMTDDLKKEIVEASSTPSRRGRGAPRGPRGARGGGRGSTRVPTPRQPRKPKEKKEKKVRVKKEKKKVEAKPPKAVTPVQVFEEETRMSADIKPPIAVVPSPAPTPIPATVVDEESLGASNISSTSASASGTVKTKKFTKDLVPDRKPVTADTLYEYIWPQSGPEVGEMHMLQEQVSEYLGVKSFKRKYPDLKRRVVDMEERDFLRGLKIVSETQCDLGLTALSSSDVLDIMFNDFPDKYEEYNKVQQQRREQELVKLKGATPATSTPPVRDRSAEFYRRCLKSTAKWNAVLNRQRKEDRQCSFDLQTFTVHYQRDRMKILPPEATKVGHYPVTVLPGQFCDNYKPYTSDELKYLPLNTVLYGPVKPRIQMDAKEVQSDDEDLSSSGSDDSSSSDGSSSSGDSSSSSGDESDDEAEMCPKSGGDKENEVEAPAPAPVRYCKTCDGDHTKNKDGNPETLLHCTKCDVPNHPTCLELRLDMMPFIKKYNWQCTDCKNCIECNDPADEDKMLFCDLCDRGYHIYCIGLRKVPTGRWHCRVCSVCFSCGCTQPSPEDRLAEWHHEFKKGEKNTRHFTHSLCVNCHKLYKKGQYCPSCMKVHLKVEDNKNISECRSCKKWVHKECINRPQPSMFGFMCDSCDAAFRSKMKLPPLVNYKL